MLKGLLDDAKVGWIAAVMDVCIHGFAHFRIISFPRCGLEKFRASTGNACVQLLQLDTSAFSFIYCFPFLFRAQAPNFNITQLSEKLPFRTGRDVLGKGTALSDVLLRVCPGCRASGSPRAAAFGCYDGGDRGPNVPGYQRHRKGKVVEKVWSEEQARHVLLQCVSALSLQGVRRR